MLSNRASFIMLQVCGAATLALCVGVVYQRATGVLRGPDFGPRPPHAVRHEERSLHREPEQTQQRD